MSNGNASRTEHSPLLKPEDQGRRHEGAKISVVPAEQAAALQMAEHSKAPTAGSVAVDPVALITTECITVTSAMRKNARWAHSSVSAILGGGNGYTSNRLETSRPSTPRDGATRRGGHWNGHSLPLDEQSDVGLANRWGLRGKKGKSIQDSPLMAAFARLRSDLNGCIDIRDYDTPSLLHPFLQVIRSSSTSAPITSLALVAITKFFAYKIINRSSPRLPLAMQLLSAAITHCRFEASDSAADEIVLLRILNLMEEILSGPGGDTLGDESVCQIMETGLSMCCQLRLSELLRRSAEISMVSMCQVIFERLKHLETEASNARDTLEEITKEDMDTVKMDPSVNGDSINPPQLNATDTQPLPTVDTSEADGDGVRSVAANSSTADFAQLQDRNDTPQIKPYSLPSIRELFRALVDLLEPNDRHHTDGMRIMALRIIDVALEVAGPSIAKHPSLAKLAKDDLCRYLFQLIRSENMSILSESLRVAGTLLATCRSALKLQQELFLSYLVACLHPRVEIPQEPGIDPAVYEGVPRAPKLVKPPPSKTNSGRSTPVPVKDRQKLGMEGGSRKPDAREAMVESIGALARIPSFLVELFVNYDCEVDRSDLCEDVVGLLSRNAFPDSATWSTTNVPPLCLEALLNYVQYIAARLGQVPDLHSHPDRQKLREQRARKRIIIQGATRFNESPKAGLAYLTTEGVIANPEDPHSVVRFLKGTTRVSKKTLGEYISKRDNDQILEAFLDLFDFTGKRVDEALRELLESFRLPGESALIERILTVFSEKYCANSTPKGVADKDAVYILTYAIIMLNTDQHSPKVKSPRMSYDAFARNLRGVNGNADFAPEYLQKIYDSIRTNEIILPEEHDNQHAFDYAWKELLVHTESAGDLVICDTNLYDADMFEATWKPVVATLSYVFMSASDDTVFTRVVTGFDQCARIAAAYGLTEALDHIIFCLSSISTLASDTPPNTGLNTEVQVGDKRVMVSELAVRFGRDYKAQLATVVLFGLIKENEAVIRKGWQYIVRIWVNLFVNSLIPPYFPRSRAVLDIPPIPLLSPSHVVDRGDRSSESGLFQAFTSYLSSYAADDPPEPSEDELDSTMCTVDCINACAMEEVFSNVMNIRSDTLQWLLSSLLARLPEESSPVVIVVKPALPTQNPNRPEGDRINPDNPSYDPATVYVLELATIIALRDQDTIGVLGKDVFEALHNIIRNAASTHPVVVSRAVFYLLSLICINHEQPFIRAPIILHTISSFNQGTLAKSALPILRGLGKCVKASSPLRKEITNSPDFWSILQNLQQVKAVAGPVFSLLEDVTIGSPSAVSADNYECAIALLNDYATAGSVGAVQEQRLDKAGRRTKSAKPTKAQGDEVVARGIKAIGIVYALTDGVPALIQQSHLDKKEAWIAYWSPIFRALATQCVNPCREIRHQAFSSLQRSLLSPELACADHQEWTAIFGEVLFPLITRLLKPEVYQSDPIGMSETRVQAATLLCRIFLNYLFLLSEWDGMLDLWLRILDIMDRLMNSGQGENLVEAVPESLKNILLVMANGGFLLPPDEEAGDKRLWDETWRRLDRFLPNLYGEVFPERAQKADAKPTAQADPNAATREAPEPTPEPSAG